MFKQHKDLLLGLEDKIAQGFLALYDHPISLEMSFISRHFMNSFENMSKYLNFKAFVVKYSGWINMENLSANCENCGKSLSDATQVCTDCEAALMKSTVVNPYGITEKNPRNICPVCKAGFKTIKSILWPPNVAWYKYQRIRQVCPACHAFLKLKGPTKKNKILKTVFLGIVLFNTLFGYINSLHFIGTWIVISICASYDAILIYRGNKDGEKYIEDNSS